MWSYSTDIKKGNIANIIIQIIKKVNVKQVPILVTHTLLAKTPD